MLESDLIASREKWTDGGCMKQCFEMFVYSHTHVYTPRTVVADVKVGQNIDLKHIFLNKNNKIPLWFSFVFNFSFSFSFIFC